MLDKLLKQPFSLTNVFETMRDGMMIVDRDGNIIFLNKAAEDITGFTRAEVIGRQCSILDTDTCTMLTDAGRQKKCDLFKVGSVENKKCRIKTNDGRFVHLLKNAVILRDEGGEIIGAVESMTDITSLYRKEKEIECLKEELRQESWFMGLLGKGRTIQKLYEKIRNASISVSSDSELIVEGQARIESAKIRSDGLLRARENARIVLRGPGIPLDRRGNEVLPRRFREVPIYYPPIPSIPPNGF